MPTPALIPASTSVVSARSRWRGGAVPGSVVRQTSGSSVGTENMTETSVRARRLLEHVDVAHDQRAARDHRERRRRAPEHLEARARQPVAALGRLVRVGRGADRDLLAPPRRARELAREHLGDVDLDADRAAVAVVGGPVGAQLERADVTERAAVDAARVRVERPRERHPLDAVQRAPARLLAVLDPHRRQYRTYVRIAPVVIGCAAMELPLGIRRITTPLPTRPGHVHSYLLPGDDGWTLVDTGIGLPDAQEVWAAALDGRRGRADLRHPLPPRPRRRRRRRRRADRRAGAPGRARLRAVRARLGEPELARADRRVVPSPTACPSEITEELIGSGDVYRPFIRFQRDPVLVDDGRARSTAGSSSPRRATPTGSSACSRTACSSRPTTCSAGSRRPSGLWPASRPDPLGDFLDALERTIELAPEIALPGHGEPIADPVGRARELIEHHRERLAVDGGGATATPAHRLRALVRPLRRRPEARLAALRRRRDALAPRAARPRGAGPSAARTSGPLPILRASLDDELPPSTQAPESGA